MIAYYFDPGVIPPEWGWPVMLDIWLGTVDREDLEKEYMRPSGCSGSRKGYRGFAILQGMERVGFRNIP